MSPPVAEEVLDFAEIADFGWESLLLGNGMSINVSPRFAYESLYEEADFEGGLSERDRAIFEMFDTTNFEVVLAKLGDAIVLAKVLGRKTKVYRQRFRSIQAALGNAVRRVHLDWEEIPGETLDELKADFGNYSKIFTTSYDLLTYWAIVQGDDYENFCDCFWSNGRNEFDPESCNVWPGYIPVYYMHGALHLVVGESGATRKLTRDGSSEGGARLLDQFGQPVKDDPDARPLLVSEGSSRGKLQAIEANDYLSHAYHALKEDESPLLVFGHALGAQDQHLLDAINAQPHRPVAISLHCEDEAGFHETRHRILSKLRVKSVSFFYAESHPLGSPDLQVPGA
jgi:Domain of unknown function (DUF4917)